MDVEVEKVLRCVMKKHNPTAGPAMSQEFQDYITPCPREKCFSVVHIYKKESHRHLVFAGPPSRLKHQGCCMSGLCRSSVGQTKYMPVTPSHIITEGQPSSLEKDHNLIRKEKSSQWKSGSISGMAVSASRTYMSRPRQT
uniref:Uncharacterized protein n=1 Tax=Branchiostoma floridae TaxID=7739 RepID=C3Y861_BRAFL|eukprot:XP_002607520.1 hypothetical protein BRAFLDRAFT_69951 [Branchiostoma floridae]